MVGRGFEGIFGGIKEEILENKDQENEDGQLAENEALGESGLEREDIVVAHRGRKQAGQVRKLVTANLPSEVKPVIIFHR